MRVRRERKLIDVICVDCGCTFTAFSRGALRCAECKLEHKRRTAATGMVSFRNGKKSKPYKVKKSIREVLKELEEYNKKHGTRLSYGQFVQKMEAGEIWL